VVDLATGGGTLHCTGGSAHHYHAGGGENLLPLKAVVVMHLGWDEEDPCRGAVD